MSGQAGIVDTTALAEALLLADPDDASSVDDLRRLLEGLLPWPDGDRAPEIEPVVRTCVALLDGANGDTGDAIARVVEALTPVMEAAAQPAEARRAGEDAPEGVAAVAPDAEVAEDAATPAEDAAPAEEAARKDKATASRAAPAPTTPAPASPPASLADDPELVREFADRSREHLDEADALLLTLEDDQEDKEAVNSVFRVFHTIKGMAGFLAFQDIEEAAHDAEDKLDAVRKGSMTLDRETMDALFGAVDVLKDLVGRVVDPGAADPAAAPAGEPSVGDAPADEPPAPEDRAAPTPAAEAAQAIAEPAREQVTAAAAAPAAGATGRRPGAKVRGTVHVDEERLDRLLETIGELVIAEAGVGQSLRALPGAAEAVSAEFSRLDKISRQLQEMATSMRMVTFRTTLRRMARLVRDLSRESGKDVRCVLEGEEIELDKHVVEGITDSLIHLVRNAVDHGVEDDPQERVRAGKPATATVRIAATHTGGRIVIQVSDDGRGIDPEAVLRKARDLGVVAPDETAPAEAAAQLIFQPGFSTARTVTGVSGRGVGMDVVKRTAEALLGSVSVSSAHGEGTTVRLTLPLTLAIIDGMLVRVGGERYVIPALSIVRSLRLDGGDVTEVLGQAELLPTPQGLVPLVRLAELFAVNGEAHPSEPRDDIVTIVSEADGSSLTGLVVSELLGQQQIVMKSLGAGLGEVPGVSGAAILADGSVGLVIDVQQTVRLAHGRKE